MEKIKIKNSELKVLFYHVNYLLNEAREDTRYGRPELVEGIKKMVEGSIKTLEAIAESETDKLQACISIANDIRGNATKIFTESSTRGIQYQLGRNFEYLKKGIEEFNVNIKKIQAIEDEVEKTQLIKELENEEIEVNIYQIKSSKMEDVHVAWGFIEPLVKHGIIID